MEKGFWKKHVYTALTLALCAGAFVFLSGSARAFENLPRCSASMDEESAQIIEEAGEKLTELAAERDIMALVYLQDTYDVKETPDEKGKTAVTVLSGQLVNLLDVYVDENYEVWEYVSLEYNGQTFYGYVKRANLACSDSRFLEWEETYGMNPAAAVYTIAENGTYADVEQFPESYRPALNALKQQHPNWIFAKMNTTLDWDTVIYNEMQGAKSLVYKSAADWAKNGLYDSGNWYYASRAAVELYMDPRNALQGKCHFPV